ncbi:MAG TPA: DUF952 domain-containing protein [Thermotogota bacterium]|nr:DUF952 domain-containing protein [Thermotogota bacterium]HPJ87719.1 DUF952 domain-containing protein [Thermotogota bacterium]HPR94841.1 DUF952 domain-containing protein [Thermotogota bacterium]
MILHIVGEKDWENAKKEGIYKNESLAKEGFIHCSLEHQVCKVADKHYAGEKELLLLYIDEGKVESKVVYEDLYDLNEDYPHIYGPLNTDAVVKTAIFTSDAEGKFHL